MKPNGKHPINALSALGIRQASLPGRYADGNGLYLVVAPSGAKRWILRTVIHGRRRDIGLGSIRIVTLVEARARASSYRGIARSGGDPLAERNKARRRIPTFTQAVETVHREYASRWKNPKHKSQWFNTLDTYAVPQIGSHQIDQIDTPDILRILAPIWLTKHETARRLKQRLHLIFDWAKVSGYRNGENPVLGVEKGLPKKPDRVNHHAALPYVDVSAFIESLRSNIHTESVKLAFEFLILTAARTSEVLMCNWEEIDFEKRVWSVPAARMKAGRDHRVPLSRRCIEILISARKLPSRSKLIFPGRDSDKPMSSMVFLMTLRRMDQKVTAHGFRSAFRDWAAERTNFSREVCEMALAHSIADKTEAAYRRGELFEKRRALMDAWAAYATSNSAKIVRLATA